MTSFPSLVLFAACQFQPEPVAALKAVPGLEVRSFHPNEAFALIRQSPRPWAAVLFWDRPTLPDAPDGFRSSVSLVGDLVADVPGVACVVRVPAGSAEGLAALRAGAFAYVPDTALPEEVALVVRRAVEWAERGPTLQSTGEDARLVAERRANNMRAVREITTRISSASELREVLFAICEEAVQLFGVDHSGLVLFDEHYDQGTVEAEYPLRGAVGAAIPLRSVAIEEQLIFDRRPVIITDIERYEQERLGPVGAIFTRFGIRSILIVPIIYGQRVLGSLSLDILGQPCAFDEEMVETCEIFAAQVAIAIAKAQQLDTLRAHTIALTAQLDEHTLFERIACEAAALLNADGAGIYTYDQEAIGLRLVAGYKCPGDLPGKLLPLGEGMAGRLFLSSEPFMTVDNYAAWPGRASIYAENCPFESVAAAPLRWMDEVIGVLFVNDRLGRSFTRQDGSLLRVFADYAAAALINNEKLARIRQLSQAISLMMSDLDEGALDDRLNRIARAAVEILGAETSGVLLVARPQVLRLVAGYGHRPEVVDIGREFHIESGVQTGLTGWIAALGEPVQLNGDDLINHPAVRGLPAHTISARCYSLLALPLFRQHGRQRELIGLIRIDNKKDRTGCAGPTTRFTEEDVYLFRLFGDAVSIAVENATLALHWKQLINSSPSSVVVNNERGIVTTFSAQAEVMLGYPAEAVQDLLHVDRFFEDREQSREIGRSLHEQQSQMLERQTTLVTRDGLVIPVRLSATAFYDVLGQRRGTIGYFEDLRPLVAKEWQLERLLELSETMRRIGDYIQGARNADRILRAFLNAVTAAYGLQFDCAALLLYHEEDQSLRSAFAVGQVVAPDLRHEQRRRISAISFDQFIGDLSHGRLEPSPLEGRMRDLTFATDMPALAPLRHALTTGKWVQLRGEELATLPPELLTAYVPGEWLVVVPLITATRAVGLLLADRRFNGVALSQEERDLLMALAGTAALAVSNSQLLDDAIAANDQLRYLFEAGTMMVSSRPPREILKEIVGCLREATDALWVSLFLIDAAILRDRISTREGTRFKPEKAFRPEGVSIDVMARQQPAFFADTTQHRDKLNPILFAEHVGSAACIPFILRGKSIGVVWIQTAQPRTYTESHQQAIQLFVNQAAVAYESSIRVRDLELMREATDALARAERWEEVLQQIAEHARAVLKAHKTIVWFYDSGREQFVPEKSKGSGISQELMDVLRRWVPRPDGTSYQALQRRRIVVEDTGDPRQTARIGPRVRDLVERCRARSLQIISLRLGGENLGVLYALYDEPRSFGDIDAEQSQIFAENAANALKKAMLLETMSLSYSTARAVAQATVRSDLSATLREIASGIRDLINCDLVSLYIYDEKRDRIALDPIRIGASGLRVMNRPIGRSVNPLLELALSARQPTYFTNVADEPIFQRSRFVRDEGIHSSAAVPLRVGTSIVGAMFISYRTTHRFSAEEQRAIRFFSEQAAVAINTSLLTIERNEQLSALKALHQAAYAVTRTKSLEELFQTIVEQAVGLVRERSSRECFAHYARVEGQHLRFAAAYPPSTLQGLRDEIGDIDLNGPQIGVTGQVVRNGKLRNIGDVTREPAYIPFPHLPEIKAELVVPVVVRGVPVGVINLESPEFGAFTAHDEYAVEALAQYVAVAIETWQLQSAHEQMERSERRLAVISQITSAIVRTGDLGELLHHVCDLVVQGSDRIASIWLYDTLEQALVFDPAWSASFKALIANEARSGRLRLPIGEGICGWVVQTHRAYCCGDITQVTDSPQYVATAPKNIKIASEICVPILYADQDAEQVVGVIDVQSSHDHAFDDGDEAFLSDVARVLAAVISREQTRRRLAAVESLALTGVAGSLHWHKMIGLINNVSKRVQWLQDKIAIEDLPVMVRETLTWIENRTQKTLYERLPPPLDSQEHNLVPVHQLLRGLVAQFRQQEDYADIRCDLELRAECDKVQVRANSEWLRHGVQLLIDNAAAATKREPIRRISVSTRCLPNQSYIEICIGDNGHGIGPELQQRLFHEQIETTTGSGMGVGALLVRRISETYGGYVRIADPGPYTTSLILALPIAQRGATDKGIAPNST